MALAYRSRRTLANALLRARRDPRQLIGLLVVLVYAAINLGTIAVLLALPMPQPLRQLAAALVPGGVAARLEGVRGTLTIILLSLASTAAFENPLLQFGQSDIDLVFPSPIPSWRLLLSRLQTNHLRALAAAYFFWGLTVAPLLRFSGDEVWPAGAWALLALTCSFAAVDQIFAAALLWLAARGASRALMRGGLVAVGLLAALALAAGAVRLATGSWDLLAGPLALGSTLLGWLFLPVGLAVDVLLEPAHRDGGWPLRVAGLVLLDLGSAAAVMAVGPAQVRELAVSPVGRGGLLRRAMRQAGANPLRFAQLAWSLDPSGEESGESSRLRPFGRGAGAVVWARMAQMARSWPRMALALVVLGVVPLAVVLSSRSYSLATVVTAVIFSASLATQLFNELRDHLTSADTDLALPLPRWQLLAASILAHVPVYWLGGLVLIFGIGVAHPGADWAQLLALGGWYPLVVVPLLALRGAVMFLFPSAALPGRRDPVQYVIVALVNGLVTAGLLALSLLPVGIILAASRITTVGLPLVWGSLYVCGGVLTILSLLALGWAYGRFEPREGL